MKYILDFDRTIFDMDALYRAIEQTNPGVPLGTVASLDGIDMSRFFFADVMTFLQTHNQQDIEIVSSCHGLTKRWSDRYQAEKIKRSGIDSFVAAVHVVSDSKIEIIKTIMKNNPEAIFVDDHPEHVASVSAAIPELQVFFLNRKNENQVVSDVPGITSLADLDDMIAV